MRSGLRGADLLKVLYMSTLCELVGRSQQIAITMMDATWALAHGVRCVYLLSCSMPGSLVDPLSSCRGSVDPTRGDEVENKDLCRAGVATYEGNHHEVPRYLS
jgi:hypothetical protein